MQQNHQANILNQNLDSYLFKIFKLKSSGKVEYYPSQTAPDGSSNLVMVKCKISFPLKIISNSKAEETTKCRLDVT